MYIVLILIGCSSMISLGVERYKISIEPLSIEAGYQQADQGSPDNKRLDRKENDASLEHNDCECLCFEECRACCKALRRVPYKKVREQKLLSQAHSNKLHGKEKAHLIGLRYVAWLVNNCLCCAKCLSCVCCCSYLPWCKPTMHGDHDDTPPRSSVLQSTTDSNRLQTPSVQTARQTMPLPGLVDG